MYINHKKMWLYAFFLCTFILYYDALECIMMLHFYSALCAKPCVCESFVSMVPSVSNDVPFSASTSISQSFDVNSMKVSPGSTMYWTPDCDPALKPCVGMLFKTLHDGMLFLRPVCISLWF
ncbi:unnamed protein product [Cuscuta epithymum]|uniref:Secreted protein n=2 Tax=Cuscuta epithymum TaxID=186058 RepID=A0AAV0DVX0_9ASTE|nr:unnamed protein product [Cuscuta epithymum]